MQKRRKPRASHDPHAYPPTKPFRLSAVWSFASSVCCWRVGTVGVLACWQLDWWCQLTTTLQTKAATAYLNAGLSIIPIALGGDKNPGCSQWKGFQQHLATQEQVNEWFKNPQGIAIIGGKVSGNLECIDFECSASLDQWKTAVESQSSGLVAALTITETPGGKFDGPGYHVRYRVDGPALGCRKLAHTEDDKLLIELKGEGGYALAPGGSVKAHKSGRPYKNCQGSITTMPVVTSEQRDIMISAAIALDKAIDHQEEYQPTTPSGDVGNRPGDLFNARGDFSFLADYGWKYLGGNDRCHYWRRPGKDEGSISATTGYCRSKDGIPGLFVFSTAALPLKNNRFYSPFSAYALLKHGGDYRAAARDIAQQLGLQACRNTLPTRQHANNANNANKPTEDTQPSSGNVAVSSFIPFPEEMLPSSLEVFVRTASASLGCDASYIALPMLVALAAAIGNTVRLSVRPTWQVLPVLWGAFIGPSGVRKSPPLDLVFKPLHDAQNHEFALHAQEMQKFENEKLLHEKNMAAFKRQKNFSNGIPIAPKEPPAKRYLVQNATIEALVPIFHSNPHGLCMVNDELASLLLGHDKYGNGKKGADESHYLSMYNGRSLIVDRKTGNPKTLHVKEAALSIVGGIQPGTLRRAWGAAQLESGMAARFLLCYPPPIPRRWNESETSPETLESWSALIAGLIQTRHRGIEPLAMTMDADARTAYIQWFNQHNEEQIAQSENVSSAYSKLEEIPLRLAIILHLVRFAKGEVQDRSQVDHATMCMAIALADWFKNEAKRIYADLFDDPDRGGLFEWIRTKGGTNARQLAMNKREYRGAGGSQRAKQDLDALMVSGKLILDAEGWYSPTAGCNGDASQDNQENGK